MSCMSEAVSSERHRIEEKYIACVRMATEGVHGIFNLNSDSLTRSMQTRVFCMEGTLFGVLDAAAPEDERGILAFGCVRYRWCYFLAKIGVLSLTSCTS